MSYPVSDSTDLLQRTDHTIVFVNQTFQHHADGIGVIRHRGLDHNLIAASFASGRLIDDLTAFNANALAKTFGQHHFRLGVNKLVF